MKVDFKVLNSLEPWNWWYRSVFYQLLAVLPHAEGRRSFHNRSHKSQQPVPLILQLKFRTFLFGRGGAT